MNRYFKRALAPMVRPTCRREPARTRRLAIVTLEDRLAPAAQLTASFDYADGVLRIEGTDGPDVIRILNAADQVSVAGIAIRSTNSGPVWTNVASIPAADIGYVDVRALAGNDRVEMTESNFTPEATPRLVVHGQQGNDTLISGSAADGLYGGTGNDVLTGWDGADVIEAGFSSDSVTAQAAQLDREYGFYLYEHCDFENYGGRGEKWIYGSTPDWGYFILPNGELYSIDLTYQPDGADVPALADEAKVWAGWVNLDRNYAASGTLIATLDPSYHQNLHKLVDAAVLSGTPLSQDPLGPLAAQLDRDLGLGVEGEENIFGGGEKWLVDVRRSFAETDGHPEFFYYLLADGSLYRSTSWDELTGDLVATLDPSYYQDPDKLTDAQFLFGDPVDNDSAAGDAGNDTILGGDGADSLTGGLDNDRLVGGNDNDTLVGSQGNDELVGCHVGFAGESGNPDDSLWGGTGDDSLYGGDGADVMQGHNGSDHFRGDDGGDRMYGGFADATSETGAANDTLEGGDGPDVMYGGVGDDVLIGQNDNDYIEGGRGNDSLIGCFLGWAGETGNPNDTLYGGDGNDALYGGDGADRMAGQGHNDFLWADGGNDTLFGDQFSIYLAGTPGSDTIHGGDGNDTLDGSAGNDRLVGENGNDSLIGGLGNDELRGCFVDWAGEVGGANDTLVGSGGNDSLAGGDGADSLVGQNGSDWLYGDGGDDNLDGGLIGATAESGGTSDVLYGGDGNDLLWGGEGTDTLTGDSGADTLMGEAGADDLDGGLRGFDPELGFVNDSLEGGAGGDLMWGGEGADTLFGGLGQDTLNGEAGADHLDGGLDGPASEGAFGSWDRLDGGTGDDLMWAGEGNDTLFGGEGNDILNGEAGSDLLWGGEGTDTLRGFAGSDRMFGEGGNDNLYGGAGRDTLEGGFGQDGLFGGTQDQRDDLIGGPDPDRFLSADDNDIDRVPGGEDALLHFVNWDTQWTDVEIETLDKGFAWLQFIRSNPALLKTEGENVITFERIRSLGLTPQGLQALADNDSRGKIRVADAGFSSSITPDATIVHEMGHNWDDEMGGWFTDNWLPRSDWRPADNGGGSQFPPPGYLRSRDGQWDYLATAPFVRTYGTTNPREDWCTAWEAYYVNLAYPAGDGARTNYNYAGMVPKFEVVAQFFAGLF